MIERRSAEAALADLEKILGDYRAGVRELGGDRDKIAPVRRVAMGAIRRLGFSAGDATRWLDAAARRP